MGFFPLGKIGNPLNSSSFISASSIRSGYITAQEIVLGGGTKGIIRSQNFVAGSSGWAIFGDGNVEFNNAVLRGEVLVGVAPEIITIDADSQNYQVTTGVYSTSVISFQNGWTTGETAEVEQDPAIFTMSEGIWDTTPILFIAGPSKSSTTVAGAAYLGLQANLSANTTAAQLVGDSSSIAAGDGGLGLDAEAVVQSGTFVVNLYTGSVPTWIFEDNEQFRMPDGTASLPALSFVSDPNTGIYSAAADELAFATAGAEAARFTSPGHLVMASGNNIYTDDGAAGDPGYSFGADQDSGMFRISTDRIGWAVNATTLLDLGTVAGTGLRSVAVRDVTTGSAASVFINATTGQMARSTSALKYKEQVEEAQYLENIELKPTKHWRKDDKQFRYGMIADWLVAQDPLLGTYDGGTEVENFDDRAVLAVIAAKLNRIEKKLKLDKKGDKDD